MELITVKEASARLGVKVRTIQDRCKRNGIKKHAEGYLIPAEILEVWIEKKQLNDAHKDIERNMHRNANAYASDTSNAEKLKEENDLLQRQLEDLRLVVTRHNKLFRLLGDRLSQIESLKDINVDGETPLGVVNNNFKDVPNKGMNDVSFTSSYNPNWNKDTE